MRPSKMVRHSLAEQELFFGFGTIQRFFARHTITLKKERARLGARPSRHPEAPAGMVRRPDRTRPRAPRLQRRDLGFDKHGATPWPMCKRQAHAHKRSSWSLENHNLHRSVDVTRLHCSFRHRQTGQPHHFRNTCREGIAARASTRRHHRHGQPVQPQGAKGAQNDRERRRQARIPPAIQSGFQPHRKRILKTQGSVAQGRRVLQRRSLDNHRPVAQPLHPKRMPERFRRRWIRCNMIGAAKQHPVRCGADLHPRRSRPGASAVSRGPAGRTSGAHRESTGECGRCS